MMSSDLVMVLYVQNLKLHQCSIAQVVAQQVRKATKMTMNGNFSHSFYQLTYLHVEEIIDPKATFSNEEGDVSEGGEFLEPLEEAKLFVENLAYDVDNQALAMLFEKVGTVGASLV
ncbi:unnamed protein product [Brassica oleracea var. botrytis]|uniref:(rape) hypothetical protein n=1 Tax=Brassica napus TaxID=3708 RepID=A0A078IKK6_BRANA|nr:unnamed protein product [Brassica napus]CDY49593.1 BnaC08g08910D [Brassica napus]